MIEKHIFGSWLQSSRFGCQGMAILVLACLLTGCNSSNDQSVSGTITFEGKPIEKGMVSFFCSSIGKTAQGEIGEGGTYTLYMSADGLPPGKYTVSIEPLVTYVKAKGPNGIEPKMVMQGRESIPYRYHTHNTSRLEAEIVGGVEIFDFNMTKK